MFPKQPMRITLTHKGDLLRKQLSLQQREEHNLSLPPIKINPRQPLKRILNSLAKSIKTGASTRGKSTPPRSLSPIPDISPIKNDVSPTFKQPKPVTNLSLQLIKENEGELIQSALESQKSPQNIDVKVPRIAISDYFKDKYNHGKIEPTRPSYHYSRKSRLSFHSTTPSPQLREPPSHSLEAHNKTIDISARLKGRHKVNKSDLAREILNQEMKAIRALEMQKKRESRAQALVDKVKERIEIKHDIDYKSFVQKHFKESPPSLEGVWSENKASERRKETIQKIHRQYYGGFWNRHQPPKLWSELH